MLRDQLVTDVDDLVSPNPDVALIDEADSVLVDEALVPLVLAGTTHRETPKVEIIRLVGELIAGKDYDTDADSRNVHLTEAGAQKLEAKLGGIDLYSEEHVGTTLTEVNVALHAHVLLQRDVHYIVRDDAVHLINASRGRIAQLQRWPDGLQAAVEAKEGIETTETGEVLDTITVQALINRYPTVCGMTGTALAAGEQLRQFYKLGVSPIPPNTPNIREDEADRVYITAAAKNDAIVEHIAEVHETGQPVLVGTRDVAESEELHERLVKAGVPAVVLNAKNDAEEAARHRRGGQAGHRSRCPPRWPAAAPTSGSAAPTRPTTTRSPSSAGCTSSAPAATTPSGWTTSCAAAPAARATPARRCSSPAGRTTWWSPTSSRTSCRLQTDDDGRIVSDKAASLLDHAQRVAEGRLLDVHANTWRYNQLIAQQRAILVERRDTLLRTADRPRGTGRALTEALRGAGRGPRRGAAGEDLPADHAVPPGPRLGRPPGLPGRHPREHPPAGAGPPEPDRRVPPDGRRRVRLAGRRRDRGGPADLRDRRTSIEDEPGLDLSKLARPTSTWTYMVHDNPLADDTMSALSLPGVFR